ncbi:MAG TPA: phosphatidylglycerol lysyltransferase domain-containing protein [Candidatus Dormibacteraeota bacterium]|nr:phosphatidylglycerol lysyltransferase domain-containing protein [Candidatus Dormibacteraeota bacterium]
MSHELRAERRKVRWFFAGLLIVSAILDVVGALLIQHQTRSQVLNSIVPASVTLGGRTGAVLAGLALLLLAGGIARGKRVALRLTLVVLAANIAFDLIKDLDFETASLSAWILFGLWWFRHHFEADSDPSRVRWGLAVLAGGIALAVLYAVFGIEVLGNQLTQEGGPVHTLESLAEGLLGNPTRYRAITERASWFLGTLPVVSYALVLFGLIQLLRPVLAPRPSAADRERVHELLKVWGRNHISHLAVHGDASYHWFDPQGCVAFSLHGRTALALGDPIGPPDLVKRGLEDFVAYCERQDWIPAFYQVDSERDYRELALTLVPIGSEALIHTQAFGLQGKERHDLRYAMKRCEKEGLRFSFMTGPDALAVHSQQLHAVSGTWLRTRQGPELSYSLGTLSTLTDPDIMAGLALAASGRLEAFVSWLPVPARKGWTLDLMRRRPDSTYGVMEALIVHSIEEASRQGLVEVSLGVAPRVIPTGDVSGAADRAVRTMFWGLDRFQRSRTLHHFKAKFNPLWEDRYLAVPSASTLPEVLIALVRAHVPPLSAPTLWLRSALGSILRPGASRPAPA